MTPNSHLPHLLEPTHGAMKEKQVLRFAEEGRSAQDDTHIADGEAIRRVLRFHQSETNIVVDDNCRHRRKASVRPPSTGKMCPEVQRVFGLARNRMASAQSAGSMG